MKTSEILKEITVELPLVEPVPPTLPVGKDKKRKNKKLKGILRKKKGEVSFEEILRKEIEKEKE